MTQTTESLESRLAQYTTRETTPAEAHALLEEARARCPVARTERSGGFHIALDYHEAKLVHASEEVFANAPSIMRPLADRPQLPPLEFDGPIHKEWRKLFTAALNPQTPARIEAQVRADVVGLVDRLVDRLADGEDVDLLPDFAEPIPLRALCHVIGLEPERASEFRRLANDFIETFNDPERAPAAIQRLAEYGVGLVMERQAAPRDDYLTWLGRATLDGKPVSPAEIGVTMVGLLVAGHDTSVGGLTSTLFEVLSRPHIRQQLLEDPSLIPAAVDEALRLHPPFFGFFREAIRDTELGGVPIKAGESLQICWAAANRDPKVFEQPVDFRLDLKPGRNRHLTFGYGIHACPGRPTALMEMRLALEELLKRVPDIELIDPEAISYEFLGGEAQAITSLRARAGAGRA